MIGATFRLGFDSTQVSRGLGSLTRSLSRSIGGISAAAGPLGIAAGAITGLLGGVAAAAAPAIKDVSEWAGNLTDMSNATGMSIEELVILEEKFRLAGVSAAESGIVVSKFAKNLKDAASEGGPAAEALRELGFDGQFIVGKSIGEAFDIIAQKIATLDPKVDNLEGIMSDLFGAKLGYQQLKLFRDYAAVTKQAKNNVGSLAKSMNSGAGPIDQWGDALGRIETFKRSLVTIGMDEFFKLGGGPGGPDKFFDTFDPEKLRPKMREIGESLHGMIKSFTEGDGSITKWFNDIGKSIGKSIGEGIKDSGFSIKDLLFPKRGTSGGPQTSNEILPELQKHTSVLTQIRNESAVSRFA